MEKNGLILMPELETYFDQIDLARVRRIKELSEVKRMFVATKEADPLAVQSKAVVVLSYASWEGFYNDCVATYCQFLADRSMRVIDTGWLMLVGALSSDFDALRDRNHSRTARREFVEKLKNRLECEFGQFDRVTILARSNLSFDTLSENYAILGFDIKEFVKYRIRIDKEVVGWRHRVAHGDSPELDTFDVNEHVEFVGKLLAMLADRFQQAMLERV